MKKILKISTVLALISPLLAMAGANDPLNLEEIIKRVNTNIVNPLIFLLLAVALVVFLWGLVSYFQNIDNAEERSQGIRHMIWGVIGLVIMISFAGIINIIKNLVGS